jgi:hypothetical protein
MRGTDSEQLPDNMHFYKVYHYTAYFKKGPPFPDIYTILYCILKKIASSIYDSTYAWRDNILTLTTCTGTYRNKW